MCRGLVAGLGSPPPTRGTQRDAWKTSFRRGITPAYAGNTCPSTSDLLPRQDHPRLRGEHGLFARTGINDGGSPPPTRGTPTMKKAFVWSPGITPAYAGNTYLNNCLAFPTGDHPRLRGEHTVKLPNWADRIGSPPPTRGTPVYIKLIVIACGITPAYAGNTWQVTRKTR